MSIEATKLVWAKTQATGNAMLVLLAIAEHINAGGKAWPSIPRLARYCRISERSVMRNLAVLEDMGEIQRTVKLGRSTTYQIVLTPDASVTPDATVTPDASVTRPLTPASPTPDASVTLTIKNRKRTVTPPNPPLHEGSETNDGDGECGLPDTDGGNSKPDKKPSGRRRVTPDFWPTESGQQRFKERGGTDLEAAVAFFIDLEPNRKAATRDADAAWRNFCDRGASFGTPGFAKAARGGSMQKSDSDRRRMESLFSAAASYGAKRDQAEHEYPPTGDGPARNLRVIK